MACHFSVEPPESLLRAGSPQFFTMSKTLPERIGYLPKLLGSGFPCIPKWAEHRQAHVQQIRAERNPRAQMLVPVPSQWGWTQTLQFSESGAVLLLLPSRSCCRAEV